jgi:hypothetical protein
MKTEITAEQIVELVQEMNSQGYLIMHQREISRLSGNPEMAVFIGDYVLVKRSEAQRLAC